MKGGLGGMDDASEQQILALAYLGMSVLQISARCVLLGG